MLRYLLAFLVGILVFSCSQSDQAIEPGSSQEELIAASESINVSRYPVPLQNTYDLFVARCSTCHSLKDTIQSPEVLPTYWEKTVREMYEKKDSGMTAEETHTITEFLIYDSYKRRSFKYKRDLRDLPPEQQKVETEKMEAILKKFQGS